MLDTNYLLHDRYQIERVLGEGGMGTVYQATDVNLQRRVALKEANTRLTSDVQRTSFEREARLLANLNHTALPKVSDYFIENDKPYLVMDFISGSNLSEVMRLRDIAFHPAEVLAWADTLLDALEYLHNQPNPVIHRDIKPENIKLTSDDKIFLLDFGLAKGAAGLMSTTDATRTSIHGSTPAYAPIEQDERTGTDARSDIYSLGATLFTLLTASYPPTSFERNRALREARPDPLEENERLQSVPPALAQIVIRAMAFNRDQRFASASEMRRELQRIKHMIPPRTAPTLAMKPTFEPNETARSAFAPPSQPQNRDEITEEQTQLHEKTTAPYNPPLHSNATTLAQPPLRVAPDLAGTSTQSTVINSPPARMTTWKKYALAIFSTLFVGAILGGYSLYYIQSRFLAVQNASTIAVVTPSPAPNQTIPAMQQNANIALSGAESVGTNQQLAPTEQTPESAPATTYQPLLPSAPATTYQPPPPTAISMPVTTTGNESEVASTVSETRSPSAASLSVGKPVEVQGFVFRAAPCKLSASKTMQCEMTVVSKDEDKKLQVYGGEGSMPVFTDGSSRYTQAFDDSNNRYLAAKVKIANLESDYSTTLLLVAGVPTKLVLTFENVSLQASKITRLDIGVVVNGRTPLQVPLRDIAIRNQN